MTRQEANRKILELIAAEVEAHPDLRFNQFLHNMNVVFHCEDNIIEDVIDYYEEPVVTLKRILGE